MLSFVGQAALVVIFLASCVVVVVVLQHFARRFVEKEEEERPRFKVVRGEAVGTLVDALRDLEKVTLPPQEDPRTIFHGGVWLPRSEENKHKVVMGSTGSGKTKTMLADLARILPRLIKPLNKEVVSVVLYDDKRELPPVVAGLVGEDRMKLLSPFDRRGVAVSVADLFDTEPRANQLAEIYIPRNRGGEAQPYWNNASRDLLVQVVMAYNKVAPKIWTLRDVHEALANPVRLKFVLRHTTEGRNVTRLHLTVEPSATNVLSNTRAAIVDFRPLAAAWEHASEVIDLKKTIREGGQVVVLQPSEEHFSASRAANRLLLTLVIQYVLDFPDTDDYRLFFLLDEVQELGRIDILPRATSVIRSKGGCLYYYSQLIDSFYKEYGENDTHKILDNVPNKAVFAVHGRTAKWASEQFGQVEIERYVSSESTTNSAKGGNSTSTSTTQQFQMTNAILSGEVSRIQAPSPERGISGIYRTRLTRPFFSTITEFDRLLPKPVSGVVGFDPRPQEHEILLNWDEADLRRLNLKLRPGDDIAAILGRDDGDEIIPEELGMAVPERQDDGVFGKLRTYFRRGDEG